MTNSFQAESARSGNPTGEDAEFQRQSADRKQRLVSLINAIQRINGTLHSDTVMDEVVNSARSLTGARYGVLLAYDGAGGVRDIFTAGRIPEDHLIVEEPPEGWGLLSYLNEIDEPLRLADITSHPRSTGFPENLPPMLTFLGMPMRHGDEHVGTIFLTEKEEGQEFTEEDEETLVMLVSLGTTGIRNARTHENEIRAKADLQSLLDLSPVAVSVFDAKTGKLTSCNSEFRRMAGDLLDTPWEEELPLWTFYRADGREIPLSELPLSRVFQFGETVRGEDIVVKFPGGRLCPTLVNAAPMYSEQGELVAAMVTSQDLTPLVDQERVRGEFLGLVSEELRMPLTAIKGSVSALSNIAGPAGLGESQQLLKIIDQQTDLMRSQINTLVELTYIQSGTLSVSPETADVSDLLNEAIAEFMRGHAGGSIGIEVPPGLPSVLADKQRIGQVLTNLLYSVARHTSDTSSITASATKVDIYVAISVSARIGDAPARESSDLLQRTLGPQLQDLRRVVGGESLALAMCKGIVEAHGGRMRMESDDHARNMTITFTLPAAAQTVFEEEEAPGAGLSRLQPGGPNGAAGGDGARILAVIDDARVMGMVRRTLSRAGYTPIAAHDFNSTGRYIEEEKPQLLLLDLSTLGSGGFRLTHRLSSDYDLPIIVLSGQGNDENIERAFDMGADDYIVKPFSPSELVARISASLRKRAASRHVESPAQYRLGNVAIDYEARTVRVSGDPVHLTATEYELLHELSTKAGRIMSQDELLQRVWGQEYSGESQLLRSYIKSLRQKLGDNARSPTYIFTEHGIGYRMRRP